MDARHKTLASIVRAAGRDPVLFGYTDTSADPRTLPPDSPWLRTYEGVAPGFRVELRLPEAEEAYLDYLAERGYGRLTYQEVYGGGFRRPGAVPRRGQRHGVHGRPVPGLARPAGPRALVRPCLVPQAAPALRGRRSPGIRRCRPADVPPPVRAATPEAEGALHPWLAAHLAQPISGPGPARAARWGKPRAGCGRSISGLIAEVDHHLGRILERLARRGELDRTLVVVTADHGEMLGDHWMLGKAGFFPQAFHVPLLIRQPEGARGTRVTRADRACRPDADDPARALEI